MQSSDDDVASLACSLRGPCLVDGYVLREMRLGFVDCVLLGRGKARELGRGVRGSWVRPQDGFDGMAWLLLVVVCEFNFGGERDGGTFFKGNDAPHCRGWGLTLYSNEWYFWLRRNFL